ncbi:hypothetical protein Q5P01_021026 [Channa striata]|uniref:Uncharacterized protein n=1 Tax=Channa striata TaxID=64152 RepID=A0AA88LYH0_CHASR|nr:hypothetical protein Q5P01_021026 [Channa striata]
MTGTKREERLKLHRETQTESSPEVSRFYQDVLFSPLHSSSSPASSASLPPFLPVCQPTERRQPVSTL